MRKATASCRSLSTAKPDFAGGAVESEPWWSTLMRPVRHWLVQIKQKRRIRRDIAKLMELDDRMLADIGLSRADIQYVVRNDRLPGRFLRQAGPVSDATRHVVQTISITRARMKK